MLSDDECVCVCDIFIMNFFLANSHHTSEQVTLRKSCFSYSYTQKKRHTRTTTAINSIQVF
jgi:hypothetical protein